jgi:hypothetical protein
MRSSRKIVSGAVLLAAISVSGCVKHNDVLLFGTKTNFGVEISATPDNGGIPEFIVGYKRREAVFMPLVVNGNDSKLIKDATTATMADIKYTGKSSAHDRDAYSVFASFGADVAGGSDGNSVGLAQFFATGIAAQRLGQNPAVAKALSVQPPDSEALEQLNKLTELTLKKDESSDKLRTFLASDAANKKKLEAEMKKAGLATGPGRITNLINAKEFAEFRKSIVANLGL